MRLIDSAIILFFSILFQDFMWFSGHYIRVEEMFLGHFSIHFKRILYLFMTGGNLFGLLNQQNLTTKFSQIYPSQNKHKIRYLFLTRNLTLFFYMDHYNPTFVQNLPQTLLPQKPLHNSQLYQQSPLQNYLHSLLNTQKPMLNFSLKKSFNQYIESDQNGSMICNKDSVVMEDESSLWGVDLSQYSDKNAWYMDEDHGFGSQQDWNRPKFNASKPQQYLTKHKSQIQEKKSQSSSDDSDQEEVFSEKLSLIRNLQQKLSSLHDKIKLPSNPYNYLEECKNSLQKQYQAYTQSTFTEKNEKDNYSTNGSGPVNQLSQISRSFTEKKSFTQHFVNHSIESESMLLDKDFELYCNEKQIPSSQLFAVSAIQKPEVKIIETIRIVEIPYLIEVNREVEDAIMSKKSFYFQENQDVHRVFEQFTSKQVQDQSVSLEKDTSFNKKHIDKSNMQSLNLQKGDQPAQNPQTSILSGFDESNGTFHKQLKQKQQELFFNQEENNNQILSKLESKGNQSQIGYLEDKVRGLEIENLDLKEKVRQLTSEKQEMDMQRLELAEELIRLSECEQMYEAKLNNYKVALQNVHGEFEQIMHIQQMKIKAHSEKQIQQFQNQQSEYANRIINFEQLFEEQKIKEQKLSELIETQNQQIIEMQKNIKDKDIEIESQVLKRRQIQEYVIVRQKQLKGIIQSLQRDNSQLNHIIHQMQLRHQSQGFYILNEQAQELKRTLQQKETHHLSQLDRLQSRYSELIQKYQLEIENMKKGLEKVRLNRSNSYNKNDTMMNFTNPQEVHYYPKVNQVNHPQRILSPVKKRQSIFVTKFGSNMNLGIKGSLDNNISIQLEKTNPFQMDMDVSNFSGEKSFVSQTDSESSSLRVSPSLIIQQDHAQQLMILEIENLKYQNSKLQQCLSSQRQEKLTLSQKLSAISSTMGKYLEEIALTEQQQQKNDQTFMKCIKQLQNQFSINKRLKQKLIQSNKTLDRTNSTEFTSSSSCISNMSSQSSVTINQEQVKVHPIFIQLSNKYKCSKKHIGLLEKQLKQLVKINNSLVE